jgi:pentatricopeptide repeat protein
MKDNGIKPDINTYNYLLDACSRVGMGTEAFAIFEDMQLVGIPPNRQTFHSLINVR